MYIAYSSIELLKKAYESKEVDFILVPSYNSHIGVIEIGNLTYDKKGSVEHPIELNLYCNNNSSVADFLLVEPHIQKEAADYIKDLNVKQIINVKSSIDGMKEILGYTNNCFTIASSKNECNLLFTIGKNIVKHNMTTFTLY